jgi:hypothetical protein
MQTITTVGLDIAKSVFQAHGVDAGGQVIIRRHLKRRGRAMLKRRDGQRVRRNATRSRFSSPVSLVPSTKLKNSTVSSSVSRRPSCM